jgi:plasmid stabilization system protein ParE
MELRIKWTDFSKKQLKEIFEFYKEKTGVTVAKKLVAGIAKQTLKLKKHPIIGQEEELLKDDPREFRYLVYKNYKIVYLVVLQENTVEVFDVFDTRQSPEKIKRVK